MEILDRQQKKWWPLRVAYNGAMKVKHELDSKRMESFLPMTYRVKLRGERRMKELVPAIANLIFVYCSFDSLAEYKATTALPIRYIMDADQRQPIVVPTWQMESFIAVAGHPDEQIIYLELQRQNFKQGDLVRITEGVFKGAVGQFIRIKGDRRVVVSINGIAAVATTFIHPSLIEPYNEPS